MGLLYHAIDLERQFGIGPHTISFPRIKPAAGSKISTSSRYTVGDNDFKKLVTVLRLSVPYTGLIVTARERAEIREEVIKVGCTQTDASTRIDIGGYSEKTEGQVKEKQQFMLGDTRSLDEMICRLAEMGMITSFCTAGYRCGRTGDKIMGLLKGCVEGKFCKLNAILTFKEYLEDYASSKTREVGERLIKREIKEVEQEPFFIQYGFVEKLHEMYDRIQNGERDLFM
jgi:2-iminoacetate synthase